MRPDLFTDAVTPKKHQVILVESHRRYGKTMSMRHQVETALSAGLTVTVLTMSGAVSGQVWLEQQITR